MKIKELIKKEIEKTFERNYNKLPKTKAIDKTAKDLGICVKTFYNIKNDKSK